MVKREIILFEKPAYKNRGQVLIFEVIILSILLE